MKIEKFKWLVILILLTPILLLAGRYLSKKNYRVKSSLPQLHISSKGVSHIQTKDYYPAQFNFKDLSDSTKNFTDISGKIRARGNSTFDMPKKAYKIKLDEKVEFFNIPKNKKWLLLANYADKSLMRNYLAFRLAKRLEMKYVSDAEFVELFYNGYHQGNYLLTEQVEVGKNRVNIQQFSVDTQPDEGAYLIEVDDRNSQKDHAKYLPSNFYRLKFRYPKNPSVEQYNYLEDYINQAEATLLGKTNEDFRNYFNDTAMIKWFILEEIFKTVDAQALSSIYFYKDRGGKIMMGPPWDFDIGAGFNKTCAECMLTEGWFILKNPWFIRMYEDDKFKQLTKELWNHYKPEIDKTLIELDKTAKFLDTSQKQNFKLWKRWDTPRWAVPKGINSYDKAVKYLRNFLEKRIEWIDAELNKPES